MSQKTAVILANVGTPDEPTVGAVRRYLFQFLNDRRVIDLPWLLQKFLVNVIIVPFRAPKSTKLYQMLWTEKGSPLMYISNESRDKLQKALGENYEVFVGMRYQNPSLKAVLKTIKEKRFDKIVVLPMFPQYASSTTGTISQLVNNEIAKWNVIPELTIISQFYQNSGFVQSFASQIRKYEPEKYDHIIFRTTDYHLAKPTGCIPELKPPNVPARKECPNMAVFVTKQHVTKRPVCWQKNLDCQNRFIQLHFNRGLQKNG